MFVSLNQSISIDCTIYNSNLIIIQYETMPEAFFELAAGVMFLNTCNFITTWLILKTSLTIQKLEANLNTDMGEGPLMFFSIWKTINSEPPYFAFPSASAGEHLSRRCWPSYFNSQSNCGSCMHMAPLVTFRRGDLQSLHHTDIQQQWLHVMIGHPPPHLPLMGSERDGTGCSCHSLAVSLP